MVKGGMHQCFFLLKIVIITAIAMRPPANSIQVALLEKVVNTESVEGIGLSVRNDVSGFLVSDAVIFMAFTRGKWSLPSPKIAVPFVCVPSADSRVHVVVSVME